MPTITANLLKAGDILVLTAGRFHVDTVAINLLTIETQP